jgi:hypothetical protein
MVDGMGEVLLLLKSHAVARVWVSICPGDLLGSGCEIGKGSSPNISARACQRSGMLLSGGDLWCLPYLGMVACC